MKTTQLPRSFGHPLRRRGALPDGRGALSLALVVLCASSAFSQGPRGKKGPEPERVFGSVTEVEKKGKAATLLIDRDDGGKLEVLITPRIKFNVTGKGDGALIQPKSVLSSEQVIRPNTELFGYQFTLHLGHAPVYALKKDPGGGDWYHLCGQVTAIADKSLTINCGAAGTHKLNFEEGKELDLTVSASDPDLVAAGSKVELEGLNRAGKFIPSKVTVTLEKPLTADDLHAAGGDRKAARGKAAAARASKKSGKGKTDDPAGDPADAPSDPFGVLGKKEGKSSAPKENDKSPVENQASEKKGGENKGGEKPSDN